MFIVIEGPRGVGKTTVAGLLGMRLAERACTTVYATAETVQASVRFRDGMRASGLRGRALTLALAALRTEHLESAIIPALNEGKVVVSDRYVQSSLVLQSADGVEMEEIWSYNQYCLPAISFYLEDDAEVLSQRRRERGRSMAETDLSPQMERHLYRNAGRFLAQPPHDWIQHHINCRDLTPSEVVTTILGLLPFTS